MYSAQENYWDFTVLRPLNRNRCGYVLSPGELLGPVTRNPLIAEIDVDMYSAQENYWDTDRDYIADAIGAILWICTQPRRITGTSQCPSIRNGQSGAWICTQPRRITGTQLWVYGQGIQIGVDTNSAQEDHWDVRLRSNTCTQPRRITGTACMRVSADNGSQRTQLRRMSETVKRIFACSWHRLSSQRTRLRRISETIRRRSRRLRQSSVATNSAQEDI